LEALSEVEAQPRKPGLRELKKAKTRAEIQRQALLLFRRQGYGGTTVEQIAAAAEVSPSTFFRYFPSKEDVVLYDDYDPKFAAALLEQPKGVPPLTAVRAAMRKVFTETPADQLALEFERGRLMRTEPGLRARAFSESMGRGLDMFCEIIAEREGKDPHDYRVRNLIGAVFGTMFIAWQSMNEGDAPGDIVDSMDAALAHLEAGLPL
jgi:AcrR family transcriptional regulator